MMENAVKRPGIVRMAVDCAMTVLLLLLMGHSKVGEMVHEWLGVSMFVLFVVHHVLNRRWIAGIRRGAYTPFRVLQTALAGLNFCTMLGSAVSGIMLSKHVFSFLALGGASFARTLHMLCGYWNFVLLSLHLGLHWVMIVGMAANRLPKHTALKWVVRLSAALVAAYGVYALIARQMADYLFGITAFAFFDVSEPFVFFLFDYLSIMELFVWVGHYGALCIKKRRRQLK